MILSIISKVLEKKLEISNDSQHFSKSSWQEMSKYLQVLDNKLELRNYLLK